MSFPSIQPAGNGTAPSETDDLQSIERGHLAPQRRRREPIYRPICRRTCWRRREIADRHVRSQTCDSQQRTGIEGINDRQMSKMIVRDDRYVREDIRWCRIFATAFPSSEACQSPYQRRHRSRSLHALAPTGADTAKSACTSISNLRSVEGKKDGGR